MNNLNSILVEGNLTKDPSFTENSKGTSICSFSIATNRYYKQEEEYQNEVSYLDIETWGRLAEACRDHLAKGRGVRVVGRVKQDRWMDQEGKNRSKIKIVAEHVEFKPFKKNDESKEATDEAKEEIREPKEEMAEVDIEN
jgi:single-strand DNA-binding protein